MENKENNNNDIIKDDELKQYVIKCPHCKEHVIVKYDEVRCTIFRHGIFKKNYEQMNPHTKKEECDRFANESLIYGCGKPFRFDRNTVVICDYI